MRETVDGESSLPQFDLDSSPNRKQPTQTAKIYGGHDEQWWRGQFSAPRAEIEKIKMDMESKQQKLKELHYKNVISNS